MASQNQTLAVSITTPDGEAYQKNQVTLLSLNTQSGQLGIMPDHVPVIAALNIGAVEVTYGNQNSDKIAIDGGFIEFSNNTATIITNVAEPSNVINLNRAKEEQKRANQKIEQAKSKNDKQLLSEAQSSLAKAKNRINVASNK